MTRSPAQAETCLQSDGDRSVTRSHAGAAGVCHTITQPRPHGDWPASHWPGGLNTGLLLVTQHSVLTLYPGS